VSIIFNADEVLQMAEQIERNGAKFYRQAAEQVSEPDARKLLLDLAAWEDGHIKVFADMRKNLLSKETEPQFFDPNNEAVLYLKAMADGHVFGVRTDVSQLLTGDETLGQIIQTALGFERDSIAFYLGMRDLVTEELGKGKVDNVIEEEKRHVVMLSKVLGELGKT